MGKQAPAAPDYAGAAAQQNANNRPTTVGPNASQRVNPDGSIQLGYSGPLAGANTALQQQAAGALGQPMDWAQFGTMDDGSAARQQAIESAYGQATSRLDPQWQRREEGLQAQLVAQGLDPSSEAARNAMGDLGQQRNDAYTSALNAAVGQGNQAGAQVFQQNLAARQQAIAEALRQRGMSLSDLQAMQGLLVQPQFAQDNATLPAAIAGGNYGLARWQAENQANADLFGGVGDLAGSGVGAALLLSDARAKLDVQRLPVEVLPGVPLASWVYRPEYDSSGQRYLGVVAQDLARVAPRYVHTRPDGLLAVDYSFLREVAR